MHSPGGLGDRPASGFFFEPKAPFIRLTAILREVPMLRLIPAFTLFALLAAPAADPACCYFSAVGQDVNQPAQKAFITWDPDEEVLTWTVQPKFEGNAVDFGMVIPTP